MALEKMSASGVDFRALAQRAKERSRAMGHVGPAEPEMTPAQRDHAHRVAMSRQLCEIPVLFAGASFDRYPANAENQRAVDAAHRVVDGGFADGLAVWGEGGVGKTHLMAVIAEAAIAAGRMTIFLSARRMFDTIRDSYQGITERDERHATELRLIKRYSQIDVLILNDFGKEPLTRWSIETLHAIMDARWESGRKLYLTSNLGPAALNQRYASASFEGLDKYTAPTAYDRILGMTGGPSAWIKISGTSHRWTS